MKQRDEETKKIAEILIDEITRRIVTTPSGQVTPQSVEVLLLHEIVDRLDALINLQSGKTAERIESSLTEPEQEKSSEQRRGFFSRLFG